MMLSDRRPILLANARIVDPSRDLDFAGDLLIAEGILEVESSAGTMVSRQLPAAFRRVSSPSHGPGAQEAPVAATATKAAPACAITP